MISIVFMFLLFSFPSSKTEESTDNCPTDETFWSYYPCSFMISHSPTLNTCSYLINTLLIDHCLGQEILFFWHFPVGNLTLTFEVERFRRFSLIIFTKILLKSPSVKNIFHLKQNRTVEKTLLADENDGHLVLSSDASQRCSVKIQSHNRVVFDYGVFLRLMIVDKDIP